MLHIGREFEVFSEHLRETLHLLLLIKVLPSQYALHQVIVLDKGVSVLGIFRISLVSEIIHCVLYPSLVLLLLLCPELVRKDIQVGILDGWVF